MHCSNLESSVFKSEIDFDLLLDELNKIETQLGETKGIKKYIRKWKKIFRDTYRSNKKEGYDLAGTECFYQEFYFAAQEGLKVRMNFDISRAIPLLKGKPVHNIPLTSFSEAANENAFVRFTRCPTSSLYPKRYDPVIAIPSAYIEGFDYAVIDGNHRVSRAINECEEEIQCILLNPIEASSLIVSNFEKACYLFLCEMVIIDECSTNSVAKYYTKGGFQSLYNAFKI